MTLPFFERVLRPTLDRWGRRLAARNNQQRTQALQEKLNLAGRPWGLTVGGYLVLRIISVILWTFIGLALERPARTCSCRNCSSGRPPASRSAT